MNILIFSGEKWWKCACERVNPACMIPFVCIFEPPGCCLTAVSPSLSPEHRNTLCNMGGRKIKWCRSNSLVLQELSMNITSNININSVDSQMRSQICCLIKGPDRLPSIRHLFTLIYIHENQGFIPHQYFWFYIWASYLWWETIRTVRCMYLYDCFFFCFSFCCLYFFKKMISFKKLRRFRCFLVKQS